MDCGRSQRRRTLAGVFAVLGAWTCGGGGDHGTGPDNNPTAVVVTPTGPQTVTSGTSVSFSADVRNKEGRSLSGWTVSWSSSDPAIAPIDQSGKMMGVKVGTAGITATVGTVASTPVTITVTPGAAAQLGLRTAPAGAVSTLALATQPVVEIRDQAGNVVTSSTLTVTASVTSGSGTLSGTTSVAAVGGVATFTDLTLTGTGSTTLGFTANGVAAASAGPIVIAPAPSIVLSASTATLTATAGGDNAVMSISVTNGGGGTLKGLAVGQPSYSGGQPTGWLTATLSGSTAPATLTLKASPAGLTAGTFTATVTVTSTNANNSPQTVAVTLTTTVGPTSIQYGTSNAKVFLLAPGASVTPPLSVLDGSGNSMTGVPLQFTSRTPGVASVDGQGVITGIAEGSGWIVARVSPSLADSVWVNVTKPAGPVVSTTLSRTTWHTGDTISVTLVLDTRGATVGGATILATWPNDPFSTGVASFVDFPSEGAPGITVTSSYNTGLGLVRLTALSANGMSGRYELATFRLVVRAGVGAAGWIQVFPQEVIALDDSSLTQQTTSTRYPLIVK